MHIAMVHRWLDPGGLITSIEYFARYATEAGHELSLIAAPALSRHKPWLPDRLTNAGIEIIECPFPDPGLSKPEILKSAIKAKVRINSILNDLKPDIIHAHSPSVMTFVLSQAKRLHVPLVFSLHNEVSPRLWNRVWPVSAADCWVAVSSDMARELEQVWGVDPAGIFNIPYGLDPDDWPLLGADERLRARAEIGIPENAFVALLLGRIDPVKGHQYLLEAAEKVNNKIDEMWLLFQGSALTEQHEQWISGLLENHQGPNIIRRKFGPPRQAYAAADVLTLPSMHGEALPLSVIEAQLVGLPVIRSKTAGSADQILHQQSGLLFKTADVDSLAKCLLQAADRETADRLALQGRKSAIEKFDIHDSGRKLLDLYQELTGGTRG